MKTLAKISARNLKGASFSIDLVSMTILIGSNFVGKSARGDAIRLLLLGYLPELGKLARSTFGLCSSTELTVAGEFSDGSTLFRRWYLKGNVVKTETRLNEILTDEEDQIELYAVMLNAEIYFALSERERVNYVFANIPGLGAEYDPETVVINLDHDLNGVDELKTKAIEEHMSAFAALKRIEEAEPSHKGWTPQSFVDFAIEYATRAAGTTKTKAAVMTATAQGLAYLRTQDAPTVDLNALEADVKRLRDEINALQIDKARAVATFEQSRAHRRRREDLTRELANKPRVVAAVDSCKQRIAGLEAELAKLPDVDANALEALRTEEREMALLVAKFEHDLNDVQFSILRNQRERQEIASKDRCPYCGATGDLWKTIKDGEIQSAIAGLRTKEAQLAEHHGRIKTAAASLGTRLTAAKQSAALRRDREGSLRAQKTNLQSADAQIAVFAEKERAIAALPEESAIATNAAAVDEKQATIAQKQEELHALETKRRTIDGRGHELQRLAQSEESRDEALAEEAVAKASLAILRAMKAKMVADAFQPLLTSANSFFGEILKTPIAYHDGEIGTWRDGVWVGHRTFSGTEKALTYAAIQAALSARASFRIMVLDELGRLDDENAAKVLRGVDAAIERAEIDQFIGIDTGTGTPEHPHRMAIMSGTFKLETVS